MNKTNKSVGTILLSSVLTAALAAGCSSSGSSSSSPSQSNGAKSSDKTINLTWLSFNPPDTDDSPVQKALEQQFNVKIKNIRVERANYMQQINLKISAGEVPDVMFLDNPIDVYNLNQQGVLAELPEKEIREKMPNYSKSLDAQDPTLWKNGLVDGKSYGVPISWPNGRLPFLDGYNGDWLKKIGYDHAPKDLKEYEDVLLKFRNNDPDGDGKKDTYGISGEGADARSFSTVFGAFQVKWGWMADPKTGTIFNGITTDKFKDALKLLNSWYKQDLIDPEFITKKAEDAHVDFINGKTGIRDWQSFQFDPKLGIIGPRFYAKNPKDKIVVGPPLDGPSGAGTGMAYSYGTRNGFMVMGAQVAKDPAKKDRIYKMLEALGTDDKTYLTAVYGIEGQHYDMKDGKPVMKPDFSGEAQKYKIGAGTWFGVFGNKSKPMEKYDYPDDTIKFMNDLEKGVTYLTPVDVFVPEQQKYPDLKKVEQEFYIKAITGEVDIDSEFPKFVDKWKKSGGEEITNAINKKYAGIYKK